MGGGVVEPDNFTLQGDNGIPIIGEIAMMGECWHSP